MIVAPSSDKVLNPSFTHPKQVKLLGATVEGLGVVTAVSSTLFSCYALIEDASGREHHRFLVDLKRSEVEFPSEVQPYETITRRTGIGTWDEVYSLVPTVAPGFAVAA